MEQELKYIEKQKKILKKLKTLSLNFNSLFILECYYYNIEQDLHEVFEIPSLKDFEFSKEFQYLKKNYFLVEDPNDTSKIMISVKGKETIEFLNQEESINSIQEDIPTVGNKDELFNEWWKAFPTTPAWTSDDGSKKFVASRNLKNITKAKAKDRYLKLLNQGLQHEELIGSLRYEIKMKKLDSIKKNANQMEYFKGMESYFNTERYLLHLEDFRSNPDFVSGEENKVKSKRRNVTDI